jgi:hypothetical protein
MKTDTPSRKQRRHRKEAPPVVSSVGAPPSTPAPAIERTSQPVSNAEPPYSAKAEFGPEDLSFARSLFYVTCVWVTLVILCGLASLVNGDFGLRVVPLGEDRNWLYWIVNSSVRPVQKAFWAMDGRNPLAPWWYLAAAPIIKGSAYGLYALTKLLDLACGFCCVMLVRQIGNDRDSSLAVYCGIMATLCSFAVETASCIVWTMTVASICSIMSMLIFCRYLDGEKKRPAYCLLSLFFYILAIGTYTIQASALIGIFGLSIHRSSKKPRIKRLLDGIADSIPYAVGLGIFYLIWSTSSGFAAADTIAWHGVFGALKTFATSLTYLFWVPALNPWVVLPFHVKDGILIAVGIGTIIGAMVFAIQSQMRSSAVRRDTVIGLAIVIIGLCAGTTVLETFSSVWVPGTRGMMIRQLFLPLTVGPMVFWICGSHRLIRAIVATLICTALIIPLVGRAWSANTQSRTTETLEAALKAEVSSISTLKLFVLVEDAPTVPMHMSSVYAGSFYSSNQVLLEQVLPISYRPTQVKLGPDSQGVYLINTQRWVPYSQVVMLRRQGDRYVRVRRLEKSDVSGFGIEFDRDQPLIGD